MYIRERPLWLLYLQSKADTYICDESALQMRFHLSLACLLTHRAVVNGWRSKVIWSDERITLSSSEAQKVDARIFRVIFVMNIKFCARYFCFSPRVRKSGESAGQINHWGSRHQQNLHLFSTDPSFSLTLTIILCDVKKCFYIVWKIVFPVQKTDSKNFNVILNEHYIIQNDQKNKTNFQFYNNILKEVKI